MLAQNFKTAEELGLTEKAYVNLHKVLRMLESGELVHTPQGKFIPNGFNMATAFAKHDCGTIGCIGGYAGFYGATNHFYDNILPGASPMALGRLFCPQGWSTGTFTVDQAAKALRSFLVTGEPDWGLD